MGKLLTAVEILIIQELRKSLFALPVQVSIGSTSSAFLMTTAEEYWHGSFRHQWMPMHSVMSSS